MAASFGNVDIQLTTSSSSAVLTSGSNSSLQISRATITNTDSASHEVTIYRVNFGGTPSASNQIVSPGSWPGLIAAGETIPLPLSGHSLTGNQSLYAIADTGSVVNLSISYISQDNS